MSKGILFALLACFFWGFIFIVPQWVTGFSSVEICLGRYAIYGIISLALLIYRAYQFPLTIWKQALYFSLMSTIVYYTCVVLALNYSTPAFCTLILSCSPITIALYGNWKRKELNINNLLLPFLLVITGLLFINAPRMVMASSPFSYFLGLILSLGALFSWSWYVVANTEFLEKNPQLTTHAWATVIGVATFIWVTLIALLLSAIFYQHIEFYKFISYNNQLRNFLLGSAFLGVCCSWLGAYLWNQASLRLSVTLSGQLTLFETIFGLIFIYSLSQQFPPWNECVGIVILLGAVLHGIRISAKPRETNTQERTVSHS